MTATRRGSQADLTTSPLTTAWQVRARGRGRGAASPPVVGFCGGAFSGVAPPRCTPGARPHHHPTNPPPGLCATPAGEDEDFADLEGSQSGESESGGSDAGDGAGQQMGDDAAGPPSDAAQLEARISKLEDENLDLREERQTLREAAQVAARQLAALRRRLAALGEDPDQVLAADGQLEAAAAEDGPGAAAAAPAAQPDAGDHAYDPEDE